MRTFKLANECRPRSLLCVDARTLSFVNFTESSIKPPYGLQLLLIIAREQILKVYSERANLESRGHCEVLPNLHLAPQSLL